MSKEQFEQEYAGSGFYCPFCQRNYKEFLTAGLDIPVLKEKKVIGGGYRLNAMCPGCGSFDRERLIYLYLKNKRSNLFCENLKVLHVAPEANLQKVIMAQPNIDYLSADLSSPSATVQMDITDIKYPNDYFDVIICNHVLEHIPDDRKAMAELYRVLKPGGWAILQVPISLSLKQTYEDPLVTSPEEREKVFGQSDHVRIYAKDYKDRLEEVGFSVEVYSFAKEFGESAIRKYGLSKDENIYICSKPGLGENFEHEYDMKKLQLITPKKRDFPMLVTPRCTYLSQNAHEDFTSDLLLNLIRDDTLFIDVGAHYGYYTLLVGTKYPKCKIISFEPVLENCEILRRNVKLNQLENVEVHNTALSNKNETRRFNITEASECSGFHEHPFAKVYKVVKLEAVTLDSLIKEVPKVPVIIKVDTEGHEIRVLEGMDEILRNAADMKLIVEFNPKCLRSAGYEPSDLLKKILQFGFEIYFVDDDKRVVYKLAENNIEGWRDYVLEKSSVPGVKTYIDLLCVKTPEELNKILYSDELSYGHCDQKDEAQGERLKLLSHLIEGQKVLQLGCGNGDLSVEIAKLGFDVVGVDISEPGIRQSIELAKKENLDAKAQFMVMDATSLEFSDNSLDTVLIAGVLEHVRDFRKLLEEAIRVVRNSGRIIVSVPNGLLVPSTGHLRVFFKDTLTTELSQYAEEITWHELPSKKWLVRSFFVKKPQLDITEGPLIDILMPTYNGRKYIKNAIKSVINQTYRNWNLVVVNDGGEDVADIINEFKDTRIKYITAEHKGKAHALNAGIRNSSGKFIGYLDDDDILYPIHLEVLVKAALEEKKDFVYSDWYEVSLDEDNREIGREFYYRLDVAPWMLIPQNYINHKCILHARSLLKKAGMYDEELDVIIDWDMIRRLAFVYPPYHVWSVTSEHICYYSKGILDNRITRLWIRDPDKAGKSWKRIIDKTIGIRATAEVLKEAIVKLIFSYYHPKLEQLGAKDAHIANLEASLQEFETSLQEKVVQIQQIQHSIPMQLVNRYQRVIERLLRPGTCRRHYYELGLTGIRVILSEGWKSFFRNVKVYLQGRRDRASKQP